jgi:hypothetical protein
MATTARDVCEDALFELNILAAGEVMGADDGVFVLRQLNTLLDELNAERLAVWATVYRIWPLTPGLSPHTIGPTGVWVVPQRPQTIDSAAAQIGATWAPIALRDRAWAEALTTPGITSAIPTDLFYNPLWPNGAVQCYPVPSAAGAVELGTRQVLAQMLLTDAFDLPPGYRSMLQKTLAERIATPYEKAVPPQLARDAQAARARVYGANTEIPRLATAGVTMPSAGGGWWDWRTGGQP